MGPIGMIRKGWLIASTQQDFSRCCQQWQLQAQADLAQAQRQHYQPLLASRLPAGVLVSMLLHTSTTLLLLDVALGAASAATTMLTLQTKSCFQQLEGCFLSMRLLRTKPGCCCCCMCAEQSSYCQQSRCSCLFDVCCITASTCPEGMQGQCEESSTCTVQQQFTHRRELHASATLLREFALTARVVLLSATCVPPEQSERVLNSHEQTHDQ